MTTEITKKLIEALSTNTNERSFGKPLLRDDYKTLPICQKNFKRIKAAKEKGRIAFIDGGNQEILHAPNFSIQINRAYYNIFNSLIRENPKKLQSRIEFFSTTYSDFREEKLFFKTLIFPQNEKYRAYLPDENDLCFDSSDRTMIVGLQRADISRVASVARRFAEWQLASYIIKEELEEDDVIVIDGTLQAVYTNESKYIEKVQEYATEKKVHFIGLSKSCELYTTTGLSLNGAIRKLAIDIGLSGIWYYPVASISSFDHKAIVLMAKLHQNAERIFRVEIFLKNPDITGEVPEKVLEWLSDNCSDLSFPGYPYGLIDADMFSRVRDDEVERYQLLLLSEISKQGKWEKFVRHIQASDAHDILNILMR